MIAMMETLIEKGHAYAAEGHVLFSVPSMDDYGEYKKAYEALQTTFDPVLALLWKILTMAQTSAIRTNSPKIPPTSIALPSRFLSARRPV